MLTLNQSAEILNTEIEHIEFIKAPIQLYEPIQYILSIGGKRLRPALVLMSYSMYKNNYEAALYPAIGIEVFHNFTLLHDDIMDNAEVRRGVPTVHARWDNNTAILSGDAMMIKAYEFICKSPAHHLPEILSVFNTTSLQVCEGQQYDMDFEKRTDVTEQEYLLMIELKTSVLIAAALKIGAILGGASIHEANSLYEYGLNLGIAFQLQDDLLDTYGDFSTFGKKIGGDIQENKKTFLLITALKHAKGEDLKTLQREIGATDFVSVDKYKKVKEIYDKTGVYEITSQKIDAYLEKAKASLSTFKGIDIEPLMSLVDYMKIRNN